MRYRGFHIIPASEFACGGSGVFIGNTADGVPDWVERGSPELDGEFDNVDTAKFVIDRELESWTGRI